MNRESDPAKNAFASVLETTAEYASNCSEDGGETNPNGNVNLGGIKSTDGEEHNKGKTGVIK